MSEKEIIDKFTEIVELEAKEESWYEYYDTLKNTLDLMKKLQQELQAEKEKNRLLIQGKFREVADKNSYIKDMYISKDKIREKIEEKLNYYMSYKGLEIFKKNNFKEILSVLEQLKQELLEE